MYPRGGSFGEGDVSWEKQFELNEVDYRVSWESFEVRCE